MRKWINWQDGEEHGVTVLSRVGTREERHFLRDGGGSHAAADCTRGKGECRPATRYSVIVASGEGQQIWEMSQTTWTDLKRLARKHNGLRGLELDVEREGTGLKTRYYLTFRRMNPHPPEIQEDIKAAEDPEFEGTDETRAIVDQARAAWEANPENTRGSESRSGNDQKAPVHQRQSKVVFGRPTRAQIEQDPAGAAAFIAEYAASLGLKLTTVLQDLAARNYMGWSMRERIDRLLIVWDYLHEQEMREIVQEGEGKNLLELFK